jgi:8-hydroxy-5-deazaflavin:NADPH oxidoreductase
VKVAIIGAGNVGKALGGAIARAGHDVAITARTPENAESAAQEIGARATTNEDAVRDADAVVLAVWYRSAIDEVVPALGSQLAGKTVIDVTNPVKPDFSGLAVEATSAAEELQARLPDARVVKAFNTLFASVQSQPRGDVDAFIAGDDEEGKRVASELISSIGFTPLDLGPLREARTLEQMAFTNMGLNMRNGWGWTSAWKLER